MIKTYKPKTIFVVNTLIKDVYYNNTKNYTIYYVSNEYIVIENKTGNYTEEYIYQDNILVAQVDTNGNKIAVHPDHEGSSTTFTDSQGNLLETTFYSAYGEILSGGKTSRFDYEGKEFDSVVQDYDFGFRKYNPNAPPIFNQPDTLIQNVYDPQSLNRYSFERNNPYKYEDPYGHIYYYLYMALNLLIRYVTTQIQNPQISIPRVMNAINNAKNLKDKIETKLQEREVRKVLEISDKISESNVASGNPPKIGEFEPAALDKSIGSNKPQIELGKNCENQASNYACLSNDGDVKKIDIEDEELKDPQGLLSSPVEKEKKEDKHTSNIGGGDSSGGAASGSTGCSWWELCVVN